IPRNTTIPTRKSEVFTTAEDGQTAVDIQVYQGERPRASDNKLLGTFRLDGIPPAPRGVPQIEVIFDIDANGIVNVSAQDKGTGKEQHITITNTGALTPEEVERMVQEAEKYAEEDRKFREEAELRNRADSLAYQVERLLREQGEKMPAREREEVEEKVRALREALKEGEIEAIKARMEELQEATYKLSELLYQRPGSERSREAEREGAEEKEGEGEVIDAEFEAQDQE
ncbi:MAG TPA: molecular chaperone DnaK, partial [Candidatus Latescibacteria bacterium]|nr:molecular chaperone DnaK [Candidatus Latescibacterota bacterium]